MASSTSRLMMRPRGPEPVIRERSMPCSFASRRASGLAKMRLRSPPEPPAGPAPPACVPAAAAAACGEIAEAADAADAAAFGACEAAAGAASFAPSFARGEEAAASVLAAASFVAVSFVAFSSPFPWPAMRASMSMESGLSPSSARTAMTAFTGTFSAPSGTMRFATTPSSTASTSMVALSVSISAMTSPAAT